MSHVYVSFHILRPYWLFFLTLLAGPVALAVPLPANPALATALNQDGTLRAGVHGSFDAAGYTLGKALNGRPVFRPVGSRETLAAHTADGFGVRGVKGYVSALAADTHGNLYARSRDTESGVVQWNGTRWITLGKNVNNLDPVLAVDAAGNVYAAGYFGNNEVNGHGPPKCVTKWNGTSWSSIGTLWVDTKSVGSVLSLAVDFRGNVYVGGIFTQIGGVKAAHIAKWDGTSWSALGAGFNDNVYSLAVDATGKVYAWGGIMVSGEKKIKGIAKWDGTNWSALGAGLNMGIRALAVDTAGNVYAGGYLYNQSGSPSAHVAKWDGTNWSALGTGLGGETVFSLAVDATGNVYAGGDFSQFGGVKAANIAKWDGTRWVALGTGLDSELKALTVDAAGNVYAGGNFTHAGGIKATKIAKWDGTSWSPLGTED